MIVAEGRTAMRLLMATPNSEMLGLMRSLLNAALDLVPLDVKAESVADQGALLERAAAHTDDIILLDWQLAGAGSPDLVRAIFATDPRARVVALLPDQLRQYRQRIWEAGACSSIPTERLDQEWLSSALCIMSRAMAREARAAVAPGDA
jgi:DNA-binding NarL/FixJ family response regulator